MRRVKFLSVAVLTSSLSLIVPGCAAEAGDKAPPLSNEDMLAATTRVYERDSFHLDESAQPEAKATTLSQAGFWTAWKLENGRPPTVGLTTKMLDGSAVRIEYAGPSNMFIDVSQPKWTTLPETVHAYICFDDDATDDWSAAIDASGHSGYLEGSPTIRLEIPQDRMFNDFLSKVIKGGSGKMKIRFAVSLWDVWNWYVNLDGADVAGAAFVKAAAEMDNDAREGP